MKFPTQLTVLRIILAPLFYTFFTIEPPRYELAAAIFIVASVTDWYDGYFARKYHLVSRFGTFLDPLADKVLTSIAFIAFAAVGLIPIWAVFVLIIRDVVMTILRVVADAHNLPVKTNFSAKVKTFLQMSFIVVILLLLIALQGDFGTGLQDLALSINIREVSYWGILAIVILTLLTFMQYMYDNAALVRMAVMKYILRRSVQNS